jgi:O-Antigen ligase
MVRSQSLSSPRVSGVPHGGSVVRSDSYRYARWVLVMLFIITVDVSDFTDRSGSPLRYAILFLPALGAVGAILRSRGLRLRRFSVPDRILLLLMAYGIAGSAYGRLFLHTRTGALTVFIPMTIAFSYLFTSWQLTEDEANRITRGLAVVGLAYAIMNALANLSAVSFIAPKTYRNSKVLYVALGAAAAWVSKRRALFALIMVCAGIIFFTYRSGTNAVVVLVTLVSFFLTKPSGSPLRPYVAAAAALLVLGLAIINFTQTAGLASAYFEAVQKKNNNNARIALYSSGVDQFLRSPIIGEGFTGDITETVIRRDGLGAPFKAPFHDDYIMVAAVGGTLGVLLLLWWIAATEVNALRRYRGFVAAGEHRKAGLLRVLLVTFNVLFAAALFNPELSAVGRGATAFGLYALLMLIGEPPVTARPTMARGAGSRMRRGIGPPNGQPSALPG